MKTDLEKQPMIQWKKNAKILQVNHLKEIKRNENFFKFYKRFFIENL